MVQLGEGPKMEPYFQVDKIIVSHFYISAYIYTSFLNHKVVFVVFLS